MFWKQKPEQEQIDRQQEQIRFAVREAVNDALKRATGDVTEALKLSGQVENLRKQVSDLEIQRDKKNEEYARKEREVEHMVGLERKRSEFETASAKREATIAVREESLKAERERFEKQMAFQNDRFTQEVGYLKEMIGRVLEAIPNVAPAKRK